MFLGRPRGGIGTAKPRVRLTRCLRTIAGSLNGARHRNLPDVMTEKGNRCSNCDHDAVRAPDRRQTLDAAARGLVRPRAADDQGTAWGFARLSAGCARCCAIRSMARRVAGARSGAAAELTKATNAGAMPTATRLASTQRDAVHGRGGPASAGCCAACAAGNGAHTVGGHKARREFADIVQLIGKRINDADDDRSAPFGMLLEVQDPMIAGLDSGWPHLGPSRRETNRPRSESRQRLRYLI